MSTPFLAEIKIMSFGFAPKGWALSNGQLMPINQNHTLLTSEIPLHTHQWNATNAAVNQPGPTSNILGGVSAYSNVGVGLVAMYPGQLSTVGGSQSHPNMQPFLTLNFCIALSGIFPSQN